MYVRVVGWGWRIGVWSFFFFQAEDGIRDADVTGVQTCALPISPADMRALAEALLHGFALAVFVAVFRWQWPDQVQVVALVQVICQWRFGLRPEPEYRAQYLYGKLWRPLFQEGDRAQPLLAVKIAGQVQDLISRKAFPGVKDLRGHGVVAQ